MFCWSLNGPSIFKTLLITSIDSLKLNPRNWYLRKNGIIFSSRRIINKLCHYPNNHRFPLEIGERWWFLTSVFVSSSSKMHISASGDPPVCVDGVAVADFLGNHHTSWNGSNTLMNEIIHDHEKWNNRCSHIFTYMHHTNRWRILVNQQYLSIIWKASRCSYRAVYFTVPFTLPCGSLSHVASTTICIYPRY